MQKLTGDLVPVPHKISRQNPGPTEGAGKCGQGFTLPPGVFYSLCPYKIQIMQQVAAINTYK